MKCDICGWREAKVVVYLIGGGELKNKLFLCPACSQEVSISRVVAPGSYKSPPSTRFFPLKKEGDKRCSFCQWEWEDFLKGGAVGCSHCYSSYSKEMQSWLSKNQLGMHHRGKIPINWQRQKKIQNAIFRLGRDLENAIEQENYEKAGHLKKVMEKLRSQLK